MTNNDIIKEYGDVIHNANYITDNAPPVISVSPKIDIGLGGGVPEGSLFIMTGPEKCGKTTAALTFCANAQKTKEDYVRKTFYGNIEGRLKKRDLEGIKDLCLDAELFEIIGSTQGNILSGEGYVSIFDKIIHTIPHAICVVDSFSALSAEAELTGDIADVQVMSIQKTLAKFTRRFANVLPINRVTLVGITHLMANVQSFGRGKSKVEKSGNALKYACDVKLHCTHITPLMQGDTQIGQHVHWQIVTSAIGPPGQKVTSTIKYGQGIWKEYEVAELAKDFSLLKKKGTWFTLPNGATAQGINKVAQYLEENPEVYEELKQQIFEMVGISK